MPYASIDDNMTEHPKVERLSDAAFRVYVTSICFCSRNLTDGLILRQQAAKVAASPKIIRELVDAGRWDADPEGWRVHNYLKWNKSRAEVLAFKEQQARKARGRWGVADGAPAGGANGIAPGNANGNGAGYANGNALPASPLPVNSPPDVNPPNPPLAGGTRSPRLGRRKRDVDERKRQMAARPQSVAGCSRTGSPCVAIDFGGRHWCDACRAVMEAP